MSLIRRRIVDRMVTPLTSTLWNRYPLPEKPPTRRSASIRWLTFLICLSMSSSACAAARFSLSYCTRNGLLARGVQRKLERYNTWFTTGSKTSRRRIVPGMERSPLTKPTRGSSGSSTLKHVKLNIESATKRTFIGSG